MAAGVGAVLGGVVGGVGGFKGYNPNAPISDQPTDLTKKPTEETPAPAAPAAQPLQLTYQGEVDAEGNPISTGPSYDTINLGDRSGPNVRETYAPNYMNAPPPVGTQMELPLGQQRLMAPKPAAQPSVAPEYYGPTAQMELFAPRTSTISDQPIGPSPMQGPTQPAGTQLILPGMSALMRGAATTQPQETIVPEVQGPSAQLPLFNPQGGPSIMADQLATVTPQQGPIDLRKGAQTNATEVGNKSEGDLLKRKDAGKSTATQGEVTPPKPEGAPVSSAPETSQIQTPSSAEGEGTAVSTPFGRGVVRNILTEAEIEARKAKSVKAGELGAQAIKLQNSIDDLTNRIGNAPEQLAAAEINITFESDPDIKAKLQKQLDNRKAALAKLQADLNAAQESLAQLRRDQQREVENKSAETIGANKADGMPGVYKLADWNAVTGAMDLNMNPIASMLPFGQVKLAVSNFLKSLIKAPKVRIYKNQADMARRDPAYYKAAKDARPQGDFDTMNAMGYSFGDGNVVIFSDRIVTRQQLQFVLSHETLGHFGLRGIMPASKFDAIMNQVYDADPRVKAGVDAAMDNRQGMSKAEAVEEFLADYAAIIDNNLMLRVWNSIKGFLNKLGVKFGDEIARYLVSHARSYVRNGQVSASFDVETVMRNAMDVETNETGTGRFAVSSVRSAMDNAPIWFTQLGITPDFANMTAMLDGFNNMKLTSREAWDKFAGRYLTLGPFRSMSNPGSYAFYAINQDMTKRDKELVDLFDSKMKGLSLADKATRDAVSKLIYIGRDAAISKARTGQIELGNEKLIIPDADGNPVFNAAEVARLRKNGILTLKEAREGITIKDVPSISDPKKKETRTFPGNPALTEKQYDLYVKTAEAMGDIELELLRSKYYSVMTDNDISKDAVKRMMSKNKLEAADKKFITEALKLYKQLYTAKPDLDVTGRITLNTESKANGDKFVEALNAAVIGKETDRYEALREFFPDQQQYDAFIGLVDDFRSRRKPLDELKQNEADAFILQNEMKRIIMADTAFDRAERDTKNSIIEGYSPIYRHGTHQNRVQAYIGDKPVNLIPDQQDMLIFSLFENASDAKNSADALNKYFNGKTFDALVDDNGQYVSKKVRFVAKYGSAAETISTDPSLNFDSFLHGLRMFGINPRPEVMGDIIKTLTATTNSARSKLAYSETKGYDPTRALDGIATHIRGRASIIAKTESRPKMRQLLDRTNADSMDLWAGGVRNVIALKQAVDSAVDPRQKQFLQRQLDSALYMFRQTNPDVKDWDGSPDKMPKPEQLGYSRANERRNEAGRMMAMMENNKFVDSSDLESGKFVSMLKYFASTAQLALTPAQFIQNMASVYTNWVPAEATYNAKNGFGGGNGLGKVLAAYHTAFGQIGVTGVTNDAINRAEYYENYANDANLQKILTANEAKMIADFIRGGPMQPASINNLLAIALDHIKAPWALKFTNLIMKPFNLSEQATRRAAGLASYRMAYDKAIASGMTAREADASAREHTLNMLNKTLGDYSLQSRPPAFRQGIMSLLYMYKVYPVTTIQLLQSLDRSGQVMMLGMLWALAGAAGLPFEEDLEDVLDTIAQKLNLKWMGMRAEFVKKLEDIHPGLASFILHGPLKAILGLSGDVGAKFSLADVVPGTGAFLAGAKVDKELLNVAGPIFSFLLGAGATAKDLLQYPFSGTKSLVDIARESPITYARAMGDAYAYMQNGAIVDKRGYIISRDMTAGTIAARLLGYVPTPAAESFDVTRVATRMTNYQKEITTGFRQALLKAELSGDYNRAAAVRAAVDNWQAATQGTPLYMNNFYKGYTSMHKQATMPATQRTLKASPKASQSFINQYMDAMTD
jgi:hypothetical protein